MSNEAIQTNVILVADSPASAAPALHAHRTERIRRLKVSLVSSLLVKPLSLITPMVVVPLFLRYLGSEGYGLYESIGALVAWLAVMNLGAGMGLLNKLMDCHVSGDREAARRYLSSLLIPLSMIVLVGALIVVAVTPLVGWADMFGVNDPRLAKQLPVAIAVAGITTLLAVLVDLPGQVYAAYQELHRSSAWEAAARLAGIGAAFAVVHTHLGLVGAILAAGAAPVVVRLINIGSMLAYEKPWLRPSLTMFDRRLLRATLSQGIFLFVLQLGVLTLYQADKLIIGIVLGASQVTAYAVLGRLFLIAYGVYMLVLTPLWPAHGEAIRRGDLAWVRRAVNLSALLGCSLMLGFGSFVVIFGRPLVHFWTRGQQVNFSTSLIVAMSATFALRAWVDCRSVVLNSVPVLVPQLLFYGGHALLNVVVAIAAAKRFGVEGVAWATPLTALVTSTWGYPWMLRRLLRASSREPDHSALQVAGIALNAGNDV